MRPFAKHSSKAGFTLLEVLIASTILVVVSVGLSQGLQVAGDSHETVFNTANDNQNLREASSILREEFKSCSEARVLVDQVTGASDRLVLQVPLDGGAVASWGAFDRRLGSTESAWSQVDWTVTYLVTNGPTGRDQLVRRILDISGAQQLEEILVTGLRKGDDPDGKGFSVNKVGDVWVITLALEDSQGNGKREETMHVRTRN